LRACDSSSTTPWARRLAGSKGRLGLSSLYSSRCTNSRVLQWFVHLDAARRASFLRPLWESRCRRDIDPVFRRELHLESTLAAAASNRAGKGANRAEAPTRAGQVHARAAVSFRAGLGAARAARRASSTRTRHNENLLISQRRAARPHSRVLPRGLGRRIRPAVLFDLEPGVIGALALSRRSASSFYRGTS
jgi:hypothetical protein